MDLGRYASELGIAPAAPPPAAPARRVREDAPSADVRGGVFLEQSPATQASVLANIDRSGPAATFNGRPLDAETPDPSVTRAAPATPAAPVGGLPNLNRYASELGVNGPAAAQATAGAPIAPPTVAIIPSPGTSAPPTPGFAPGTVAETNPGGPPKPAPGVLDKAWGAIQAAANTAAGAVGGGAGMVYGALEAAGNNATRAIAGLPPVDVEAQAMARARQFTPELPKAMQTDLGREYTEAVGDTLATHGPSIIALGPEIGALGRILQSGARYDATMAGGAASRAQEGMQTAFAKLKGETPPAGEAPPAPVAPPAPTGTAADFPSSMPSGTAPAERLRRAQVLQSVGLDTARESALSGDAKAAATDAQMAKLTSPSGDVLSQQLATEKAALNAHADALARATGGSQGLDQSALYGRGNAIVAPLDALGDYYQTQTKALYATAAERAQGVPTDLDGFRKALGDDSQLTNADRVHLRSAVNSYANQLGMVGEDGQVFSNGQQAEAMRQYLNDNWSPQNAGYVKALKQSLDQDVFKSAGEDVYSAARAMWAERKNTLDNPNGIARLMDSSGPNGINRAVPIEKIPDALTGMPVQQFGHIVDTLKGVPAEIQPQAAAALSEIKAQFANKVQAIGGGQAGQWNARGVNQYLQNNAARMARVFSPDEIQAFRNLNDAGNILAKDQSYPGAFVQGHNLVRSGVVGGLSTAGGAAGATVGGTLFGPAGAAAGGSVGSFIGAKAGMKINDAAALRAAKKRLVPIGTALSEIGK
jgi:hypothetical protein